MKGPPLAEDGGALHARDEYEWPIARPRIDHARLDATPWRKLFRKVSARSAFLPVFASDVLRRSLPLKFADGTTATLAIDTGAIRGRAPAGGRCVVSEIEIEIAEGSVEPVYALALSLLDTWPLSVAAGTKARRGYALAHGDPDGWGAPLRARLRRVRPRRAGRRSARRDRARLPAAHRRQRRGASRRRRSRVGAPDAHRHPPPAIVPHADRVARGAGARRAARGRDPLAGRNPGDGARLGCPCDRDAPPARGGPRRGSRRGGGRAELPPPHRRLSDECSQGGARGRGIGPLPAPARFRSARFARRPGSASPNARR